MSSLINGIFSCPSETPVGTFIYGSNHYNYIVREQDGEKFLAREPALHDREGRPNFCHPPERCDRCRS